MTENEIIRTSREDAGIRQNALAAQIGIDKSTWSKIEAGERALPDAYLPRLPTAIRAPLVRARIAELEKLL